MLPRPPIRSRLLLVVLVAGLVPAMAALAQSLPPYKTFKYDSTFRFGGHVNTYWIVPLIKDTLGLEYTQTYGGPATLDDIRDNTKWHPYSEPALRYKDSIADHFWDLAAAHNLKVIYAPGHLASIAGNVQSSEAYYDKRADSVHVSDFQSRTAGASYDSIKHHHVWGAKFLKTTPPSDLLMAGRPRFTTWALTRFKAIWDTLHLVDSSAWFDVSIKMKVDAAQLAGLSNSDVLAYVHLYRRDTAGQTGPGTCMCHYYTKFDSIAITKSLYNNSYRSIPDPVTGYREIWLPFTFPTGSVTAPRNIWIWKGPGAGDSVLAVGQGKSMQTNVPQYISWYGWGNGSGAGSGCPTYCTRLLDSLKASGILSNAAVERTVTEDSDFNYDVYSTRKADVTFLGGSISSHLRFKVMHGAADSLIDDQVAKLKADPALDTLLLRIGLIDEPTIYKFPALRLVAPRVLRSLYQIDTSDRRGLWANPIGDAPSYRILSGDLDSTEFKIDHMMASQSYQIGGSIPITYADPQQMSEEAIKSYYELSLKDTIVGSDTLRRRFIRGNTMPDYNHYTNGMQAVLSSYAAEDLVAAEVSRRRFRKVGLPEPSYPIWSVIQVHGFLPGPLNGHFYNGWRPTTPEEITAQSWVALNAATEGICFSDFTYDGHEFGVVHWQSGDHTTEYDTASNWDPVENVGSPANWRLPKMWLGFGSRYAAVKSIVDTFKTTILPVYNKLDKMTAARMEVSSTASLFRDVPMIDTLKTEKAVTTNPTFTGTGTYDSRAQTYIDLTVFKPTTALASEVAGGTQYVLLTNRRCWPMDFKLYNQQTRKRMDSAARYDTLAGHFCSASGLGNIDVRRPLVVFKNSTRMVADSFELQRVGSTTVTRHKFGQSVTLEWLKPGWGAMYKITPIVKGSTSPYGVAYNNAVHAENPSKETQGRSRLVVYERDSVIYLRTVDSVGTWSDEYLISSSTDSTDANGSSPWNRTASNMHPAVATCRSDSSTLIVWERRTVSAGTVGRVEGFYIPGPPTSTNIAAGTRVTISGNVNLSLSWAMLTPAVVGVDGGYIVAWGTPTKGVEVAAVRSKSGLTAANDVSAIARVKATSVPLYGAGNTILDSASLHPSLGYVSNYSLVPGTSTSAHVAHMAWQQGTPNAANTQFIMYSPLAADFPGGSQPVLYTSQYTVQHVTRGLRGCGFLRPSISVDSSRIACAFQMNNWTQRQVALRFRSGNGASSNWNTPYYVFGGDDSAAVNRYFEYPSVVEFPGLSYADLTTRAQGAMTWYRSNGSTRDQWIFRLGTTNAVTLPTGMYPTMMLAPYRTTDLFASTGVLYRADDASAVTAARPWGGNDNLYRVTLAPTSSTAFGPYNNRTPANMIRAELLVVDTNVADCATRTLFNVGLNAGQIPIDNAGFPLAQSTVPGLSPMYFSLPDDDLIIIDDMSKPANVTRTGNFTAAGNVTITRFAGGSANLVTWLNGQPTDPVLGPADVFIKTELVRASDGMVLWTGTDVTARGIGSSTTTASVSVPVSTSATAGESVYIRLRPVLTLNLGCEMSAGFRFIENSTSTWLKKEEVTEEIEARPLPGIAGGSDAGMAVVVAPNPLRGSGELRVRLAAAGTARIGIYDQMGNLVLSLPDLAADAGGEYAMSLDPDGLASGRYTVQVEQGGRRSVGQLVIVR